MKVDEGKIPDWEGAKYGGELILFTCPDLYGCPMYYTDGTKISYTITIPKFEKPRSGEE